MNNKILRVPLRGLVIAAPYAGLVVSGQKTWEMRSRKTNVRGLVAIIEAGSGTIIGTATLVDSLEAISLADAAASQDRHQVSDIDLLKTWCFPWVFADAILFDTPIKYNHPRGAVNWVNLARSGVFDVFEVIA